MTTFIAYTEFSCPGLHVWREGTTTTLYLKPTLDPTLSAGFSSFDCELGLNPQENVFCQLFQWSVDVKSEEAWEKPEHIHKIPRLPQNQLPPVVWIFQGTARALLDNPLVTTQNNLRIHLVTATRYMNGELFLWNAIGMNDSFQPSGHDSWGPYWDINLKDRSRSFFQFKFRRSEPNGLAYEQDYANRVWVAQDGSEIWTHSESSGLMTSPPIRKLLTVHFRQEIDMSFPPRMHIWEENSDFADDAPAEPDVLGWTKHQYLVYSGLTYHIQFFNPTFIQQVWEDNEAKRAISIDQPIELWTLEGDKHLFEAVPKANCPINLQIAIQPLGFNLVPPFGLKIWINKARAPLASITSLRFSTYPEVITSFRLQDNHQEEAIDRHYLIAKDIQEVNGWVVPGRPKVLPTQPVGLAFVDPPFFIRRPGVYEQDGSLRFIIHAPFASQVQLSGDWMLPGRSLTLQSTVDGTYWWTEIPAGEINGGQYHGFRYFYILNGDPQQRVQDPAAGWVDGSGPQGSSRLVQRSQFSWNDQNWQTPPWDSLKLYQLHPARFTQRFAPKVPFDQIADELNDQAGYLRQMHINVLQLMPVNEVGTTNSWGYDPAFFYAVEDSYGGPDALKRLVNTCHQHGVAVFLDVVFNHAGTSDNSLWTVAQGTFFDGDTAWGAMINFDHPQVIHFFEQNLVYLLEEYHVDGFRFDFTRVITRGNNPDEAQVRVPGSGGGWEFLLKVRAAAKAVKTDCILIAEHLPNEWAVTNSTGPMDSQWTADFHHKLLKACEGDSAVLPELADALKITQTQAGDWYRSTIYAESHDEVGNENHRIARVANFGNGWRMSKVAAAVTLLGRGIPMFFMGEESGEQKQFQFGSSESLDLTDYLQDVGRSKIRSWFNVLLDLRDQNAIKGPSPITVIYAQDQLMGFTRGQSNDYFILVNFGGWSGFKSLSALNLSSGVYRELWNSTWPAFAVEAENERSNGGRDARLQSGMNLQIPAYGVVILEKT
ncbi:hypothetical protein BH09BAC4_BH09BAC4_48830 [soil metagenome]